MRVARAIFLTGFSICMAGAWQATDNATSQQERAKNDTDRSHPSGTSATPPAGKPREIKPFGPPTASAKPSAPVTIPANAERIDSIHYRAKDEKGVQWDYTKTPFGVSKVRSDEKTKPIGASEPSPTLAYDLGDTVRFEKMTPFGKNVWTKNKSDLTETEKTELAATAASSKTATTPKQ